MLLTLSFLDRINSNICFHLLLKNFHMKEQKDETVSFVSALFHLMLRRLQLTQSQRTHTSLHSEEECFIGILQSLFKKVQLNSPTLEKLELDYTFQNGCLNSFAAREVKRYSL